VITISGFHCILYLSPPHFFLTSSLHASILRGATYDKGYAKHQIDAEKQSKSNDTQSRLKIIGGPRQNQNLGPLQTDPFS
jgi:hypothetical protein